MKGLRFFTRCSDGGINIASLHRPSSLTWSWLLAIRFGKHPCRLGLYSIPHRLRFGHVGLNLPSVSMHFMRQETMPWPRETPRLDVTPASMAQRDAHIRAQMIAAHAQDTVH